nr:hypothetical protein [Tanacetum cinerariifolium]
MHTNTHTSPLLTPTTLSFSNHPYSLIISSLFADTHNVVAILEKSDAAEGFEQIIDFLSGSYIHYALTVNPHIYISCIKQFWNTASVKRSGDVTRLQALFDKKKIVIYEAVIRKILQLNDAEGVLKVRVKKLEKANKLKSSKLRHLRKVGTSRRVESSNDMDDIFNQERMIADMDINEGIELEVVEIVTTAKLITEVVTVAASQVSVVSTTIPAASATILAAKPTILAATPTVVAAYTKRRKGVIIRYPEEELSLETPVETPKVKDKGKGILVEAPKPMKKKDQIEMDAEYARKLQEEIDRDHDGFNKDIDWDAAMDHNTAGYKMDFFKGMNYAQICPIFQAKFNENIRFIFKSREEMEVEDQEIIKSLNETPAQKAAKRRKLSEKAQDLRKRLEVVEDEDDDVFVDATPLTQKVPVVDYQIVLIDNKPRPDGQDTIWRNQKSVYGLALVKRWKLLALCGVHVITLSTVQLFLLVERSESKDCQSNIDAASLRLKLFKDVVAANVK